MGVINLGNLVSKLKNSLSGIFVKKTEKATKSAFGIVKIGDNVSVSSGKISVPLGTNENPGVLQVGSGLSVADGVVSAVGSGGMTMDALIDSEISSIGNDYYTVTLNANYGTYKFIALGFISSGDNYSNITEILLYPSILGTWAMKRTATLLKLFVLPDGNNANKIKISSVGGNISNVMVYGIK